MFQIRPVTETDLPALIGLYRYLSSEPDPCALEDARRSLAALAGFPGSAILAAFADGQMCASCTLIIIPNISRGGRPYALIENVVTAPNHRRRRFARSVLDEATQRSWEAGCYKVMLMTGSKDQGTLAFYEKAGFAQTKTGFQKQNT